MKTVQKIFTALFMIAPFYGAMAEQAEPMKKLVETPAMKCQKQAGKNGIKNAKWDKGKCIITACDEPKYKLKNNECTLNEKQQQKDAKSAKRELCDKTDGLWRPTRDIPCECKNNKVWDDTDGCITQAQKDCTLSKIKGASSAKWESNQCNVKCDAKKMNLDPKEVVLAYDSTSNKCIITKCNNKLEKPNDDKSKCEPAECRGGVDGVAENIDVGRYNDKGECVVLACKRGYKKKDYKTCEESLCLTTKGEVTNSVSPDTNCNCGNRKWEDGTGCVEKTKADIAAEKAACDQPKIEGATKAEWDGKENKCTITCDTDTHEATPVDGKCVKLPSEAYKTASEALKNLLKQAQSALTALTEQETKETKTIPEANGGEQNP